jgi:hypothetical protein
MKTTKTSKVRIPNLTNKAMIEAFFGTADQYCFEVSQEEFDDYDDNGPGTYQGSLVTPEEADKWDAGLRECQTASVSPRSLEGLRIRLAQFGRADRAESLAACLEAQRIAPILASWKRETEGCDLLPISKMPGWVIVLRPNTSPEYRTYALALATRAEEKSGWPWIWKTEQYDAEMMAAIRTYWGQAVQGWVTENDGSPSSDDRIQALHSGSAIGHHLGGDCVRKWPATTRLGRVVVACVPPEVAVRQTA